MEFDTNADPHYDANGLGRVHREGAPSTICLSCPCPADPIYTVDNEKTFAFSLCSAIRENDDWRFGAEEGTVYEILDCNTIENKALANISCRFLSGKTVEESYEIGENGVMITVKGKGEIGFALPAFVFDGERHTETFLDDHSLAVVYDGWLCRYTTSGTVVDLHRLAANRNGHYHAYLAIAQNNVAVNIEIEKL